MAKRPQRVLLNPRYRRIVGFFGRATATVLWWELVLRQVRGRDFGRRSAPERYCRIACRFREMAVELGGVMIKVGQFLSARVDVLPPEVTEELAHLQDEVPPEDFAAIRAVIEEELGGPLDTRFGIFEEQEQAAASLGQTHRACLPTGESVVIKVQRPGIEDLVAIDLAALRTAVRWLRYYRPISRRADVDALLAEFSRTLWAELDYIAEGGNAERFAESFVRDPSIIIPRVYWSHTTRRVLALENVEAIKITDFDGIAAAGIDRRQVAERLVNCYFKQIFEDGFFHADPHPGNLFVRPLDEEPDDKGRHPFRLIFVDFGMVGQVPLRLKEGLREILIALGTQDAHRLARAYQGAGFLLPGADLERIATAEAKAFEVFWGKSIKELTNIGMEEAHEFAREFRDLLFDMPFQIPNDVIFLGRLVALLVGMATNLDPDFNVWGALEPYARKMLAEDEVLGWRQWPGELGRILQAILALPGQMQRFIQRAERGDLEFRIEASGDLQQAVNRLEATMDRLVWGVILAALLLTGALFYTNDLMTATTWCLVASALPLLRLLWPARWRR
jgi:predicted unusual protein kinase regulating ubiquinone biosynthesis (AarF/ABC1/UbiB family)